MPCNSPFALTSGSNRCAKHEIEMLRFSKVVVGSRGLHFVLLNDVIHIFPGEIVQLKNRKMI